MKYKRLDDFFGFVAVAVVVACAVLVAFTIWTVANGWEFMR